jgi:DNA primase
LIRANATAAEFFRLVLKRDDLGKIGRDIMARRGIAPEMVEAFGLGLSPERWDGLLLTIQGKGLDPRPFAEAGLLKERDSGGFYDAFRNRLMFPIQDQIGRVIAFGGRKIKDEDEPKYLNSAETRVFEKSGTLYGLYQASRSIQAERTAIITEGYTDTIACHQAGITNVVATLGTALTPRHAAILRRLCETVVLLFDGDDAGQRAADRAVEVFFAEDLDVKIATLSSVTDAKDPDELLKREGGAEVLRRAIAEGPDIITYRYAKLRSRLMGAGDAAISRAIQDDLTRLVELGFNNVLVARRSLIIRKIAQVTKLDEADIKRTVIGGRNTPRVPELPRDARAGVTAYSTQEQALACLLCEPTLWLALTDADKEVLDPAHIPAGPARAVAEAMFDLAASGHGCGISAVVALLDDPDPQAMATEMHARMSDITGGETDRTKAYFRDCLRALTLEEPPHSLEFIRSRHAAMGGNRRVLPRPRTG